MWLASVVCKWAFQCSTRSRGSAVMVSAHGHFDPKKQLVHLLVFKLYYSIDKQFNK